MTSITTRISTQERITYERVVKHECELQPNAHHPYKYHRKKEKSILVSHRRRATRNTHKNYSHNRRCSPKLSSVCISIFYLLFYFPVMKQIPRACLASCLSKCRLAITLVEVITLKKKIEESIFMSFFNVLEINLFAFFGVEV